MHISSEGDPYYAYKGGIIMNGKTKKQKPASPEDLMKLEIAQELGLLEKVKQQGWGSLTAKETGRIGGLITRRKLQEKMKGTQDQNPSR